MAKAPNTRGEHAERYRISGQLGAGGMGEVLRGVHVELGREVAIKRLKSELSLDQSVLKRFENEARAVNLIRHENIVEVTDFYTDNEGRVHMVMELLEGRSLGDLIRASAPLPIPRAAHIGAQIAEALGAAHEHGVIHRDLKPENIFLIRRKASDDYVKLLDFGIARLRPDCGGLEATESGLIIGTPVYMSPEQAQGAAVDAATDMYSLGVLLYEMVTGHWPFPRSSAVQMMMAHIADEPQPIDVPSVPEFLEELIFSCLAKDPKDRPQSMHDLAVVLEGWAAPTKFTESEEMEVKRGLSDTFFPPSESTDERTWDQDKAPVRALSEEEMTSSSRPPAWVFGGIAAGLAVAAVVGWWLIRNRDTPAEREVARPVAASPNDPGPTESSPAAAKNGERSVLDTRVASMGLPAIPADCKTYDEGAVATLVRVTGLLADGSPGGARPADASALEALKPLKSELSPEVHLWRARGHLQSGDAEAAIRDARFAYASCAALAAAYATEGTAQAYLGNHPEAIDTLQKALQLNPSYVDARFNLALSQLATQQLASALATLTLVLQEAPELPGARYLRGQCALQLGDAVAAAADLRLAVVEQDDNANAWYALGFALQQLSKPGESNEAFCQALKLGDTRATCDRAMAPPPPSGDWEVDVEP